MSFLEDIKHKLIIADGAMGTLLYSYGIGHCFEELNLTHPKRIAEIHQAYIDAGADLIQTNTYAANREKLSRYGLDQQVREINQSAVRLAKEVAGQQTYVFGTLGGIRGIRKKALTLQDIIFSFEEQLDVLIGTEVDGLILETYYDLEELRQVLTLARQKTKLPIVAQVSLHEAGVLQDGIPLADAFSQLEACGADVVGLNCSLGPFHVLQSLEQVPLPEKAYLSAFPNASLPHYTDGRLSYHSSPDYFQESARALREQGVRLLGGCCGTTPAYIEAISKALKGLPPVTEKVTRKSADQAVAKVVVKEGTALEKENQPSGKEKQPLEDSKQGPVVQRKPEEQHLHEIVQKRSSIIVELDPPKKLNIESYLKGTAALQEAGIDALTMADNSLASPRISNMAIGAIVKQQFNVRPLCHITCRDRNLIGLQSHIMGLHTLGINQVLALTGDPTKVGDFPGASSVYDLSSFELIALLKQCNEGLSFSGKSLGTQTNFSVAAAFNPNVRHLDKAVLRLEKKIAAGADYFISQPVYSVEQIEEIYQATKHLSKPIYIGIMPLTSAKNAQFLHHEVPGIKLTDEILKRMEEVSDDPQRSQQEGVDISKPLIDAVMKRFNGIYLITPFIRYAMTLELVHYIHDKKAQEAERTSNHGRSII
jgi:homocysteine S-methyltransferase